MSQIQLRTDGRNLSTLTMGFFQSATLILRDLSVEKGKGPWFDALREEIKTSMKNAIPTGVSAEDEVKYLKAGIEAVDFVFDRIAWRD